MRQASTVDVPADVSTPLPEAADGESLNTRVYRVVKQMILVGRAMPGVQLTHEGLARELNVSRTPVREALERLHQEGYVVHRRNRGFFVGDLSPDEVHDLFGVRTALELYALEESRGRIDEAGLDALRGINARYRRAIEDGGSKGRMLVDHEFHRTLVHFSGNQQLVRSLDSVFERVILKRRVDGYSVSSGLDAWQEHEQFIALLAAGKMAVARDALRKHILKGRDRLLGQLSADEGAKARAPALRVAR